MSTCIESPKPLVVYEHKPSGASQNDLSRLVLPMLYAIVGISLGTLAGASLALSTVPTGNSMAYYHSTAASSPARSSVTQAVALPIMSSGPIQSMVSSAPAPIQSVLSAVLVRPAAGFIKPSFTFGHPAASPLASGIRQSHHPVKARHVPASQVRPARAPAAERRPEFRVTPEDHPSRPVAHPVTRPARTVLASATLDSPEPLSEQPSMDSAAPSSAFYTEGDLTVAAYDASSGTIQSSDGRTFLIGSTVSLSTATPWSDYHSDVHYRCASNGSCTLMRPGVLASNARLI
ncbi:hypothetical protein SBA5_220125 [Candidatus Sulfotelmatomonas gaucii]|uniref:Uncharacterized protein n=1 Tax=Candidatus Sulfuritelmatomonas gaucii TaxID=2043161 RepID=A0A2N9L7N3_9BACT|nr:hypothetical protein SBA5_220125 [Candidatus Sulfotelmatomonas gaucii]